MDLELSGKSVIVTGGASNIGREIVLGFAREGARITIGDIDVEQAEQVAEVARRSGATDIQVVKTDITNLAQVQAMVNTAQHSYGTIDVLVNNVGWDQLMYFPQTTPEFWEKVIRVNYIGNLNCTHTVLTAMLANKTRGAIVSLSSDAARQGEPRSAVYGGVKAGVISFMKTLAKENGRYGIRCNTVCPGVTAPEEDEDVGEGSMWADKSYLFTSDQLEAIAKAMPLKKLGRPRDVANAVLFFASNAATGHVTGQVLSVSGGYSMVD
ncbi:MAG: 2-hydroxycyclohexanecarboxyl-CoA dehydrogenase [Gammaproteobacteria bacterium]|jgi:2-hydroxycyclohexanecarboxyl-CoA dehydrogenase